MTSVTALLQCWDIAEASIVYMHGGGQWQGRECSLVGVPQWRQGAAAIASALHPCAVVHA